MKRITSYLLITASALLFLASCSSIRMNEFTRAKYTKFGHNDPTVLFNKINHHTTETIAHSSKQVSPVTTPANAPTELTTPEVENQAPVITPEKKANKKEINNQPVAAETKATSIPNNKLLPEVAPENIDKSTSAQGNSSGIDPIVLVILAILVSPLAVYLYDNAATTRFWIDLICWLLGVGFGFGIFVFVGLLWLFAVIYAVLIVTGSI
jgi:hypothetical protein